MTKSSRNALIVMLLLIVAGIIGTLTYNWIQSDKAAKRQAEEIEQLQLKNTQLQLAGQFEQLEGDYKNLEPQAQYIKNDSIKQAYEQAKQHVQELLRELKSNKVASAARIKQLQSEIETLKGICRHYVSVIDSLNRENEGLRIENTQIKSQNAELSSQVADVNAKNQNLNQRMVLAEKLNITGLSMTALKSNGRTEKRIRNAKQLSVNFTLTPNNATPTGMKTLYVRITSPEGSVLGNVGTFAFEGGRVAFTARKQVEYDGQEQPVIIYYNVNTTLNPGTYIVEVFDGQYRLGSRTYNFGN